MDITVNKLNFSYKESQVLKDISFTFSGVDTIAIVGASGCGKSTLLRILSGNLTPTAGDIYIDKLTPKQSIEQGTIGFMFQEPALMPNLTVEENVILPLRLKKQKDLSFARTLIDKVGLSDYRNYLPSELSGGMKTRVSLARTFVTRPKLILLDEPFGALDIKWKTKLYKELETLRSEFNATVLVVTHDIHEALLLSNDILVFSSKGQLLEKVSINSKSSRVYDDNAIFSLEDSYKRIRNLIIEDKK